MPISISSFDPTVKYEGGYSHIDFGGVNGVPEGVKEVEQVAKYYKPNPDKQYTGLLRVVEYVLGKYPREKVFRFFFVDTDEPALRAALPHLSAVLIRQGLAGDKTIELVAFKADICAQRMWPRVNSATFMNYRYPILGTVPLLIPKDKSGCISAPDVLKRMAGCSESGLIVCDAITRPVDDDTQSHIRVGVLQNFQRAQVKAQAAEGKAQDDKAKGIEEGMIKAQEAMSCDQGVGAKEIDNAITTRNAGERGLDIRPIEVPQLARYVYPSGHPVAIRYCWHVSATSPSSPLTAVYQVKDLVGYKAGELSGANTLGDFRALVALWAEENKVNLPVMVLHTVFTNGQERLEEISDDLDAPAWSIMVQRAAKECSVSPGVYFIDGEKYQVFDQGNRMKTFLYNYS